MKVLVVGKGGREHALCWRLSQSPSVWGLFCASGNPGINHLAKAVPIAPTALTELADFATANQIDLTVVGPEDPLAAGIVDEFRRRGLKIFGPSRAATELEASKSFAKAVMQAAGVPTADGATFTDAGRALDYLKSRGGEVVVKADGLALGKGVTVCNSVAEANEAVLDVLTRRRFGDAGSQVVIEEKLRGEELSFFALCHGREALPLGFAQDHKAIFDGDRGPNTGGMGAYSPVPRYDSAFHDRVMKEVIHPTLAEMERRGTPFSGVLFAGLMVDGDRINVLEFNVRFGDPECEALMMRLEGDLGEALMAIAEGRPQDAHLSLSSKSAVAVVLASGGYPGDYPKGVPIRGLELLDGDEPSELKTRWAINKTRVKIFHAGTALADDRLVTDGGRVLVVATLADTLERAVATAYEAADLIQFEGRQMRRDVAHRALARNS